MTDRQLSCPDSLIFVSPTYTYSPESCLITFSSEGPVWPVLPLPVGHLLVELVTAASGRLKQRAEPASYVHQIPKLRWGRAFL